MSNNLEVSFYHLYTIPLTKALPLMIVKILEQNKNSVLVLKDDESLADMDSLLWTFSSKNLVPHGTQNDDFKEKQPLYLTVSTNENPNNAEYLILTPGVSFPEMIKGFKKVFIFFDGNIEEELSNARKLWKKLKNDSYELKYWKQSEDGKWTKT